MNGQTQPKVAPPKPMFSPADLNNPAMAQALTRKAWDVGRNRGYLLGKTIGKNGNHTVKERESNSARDDVVTIFVWQAFGLPGNSNEANGIRRTLPQWIMEALFRGMDEGVRSAWEELERELQVQPQQQPIPPRPQ